MNSDKRASDVVSHESVGEKPLRSSWSGLFLSDCGISPESMIQNKQVEALIAGTSPPIVAIIPFAGGGGRRAGMATRPFLTF